MEGLKLCPLCLCEGPRLRCTVHEPRQHQGFIELELGAQPHPLGGEQIPLLIKYNTTRRRINFGAAEGVYAVLG